MKSDSVISDMKKNYYDTKKSMETMTYLKGLTILQKYGTVSNNDNLIDMRL
tara:strand:- start:395 stop:547 length:153 start_codon:yes stop_codon:yes gene_type:complete